MKGHRGFSLFELLIVVAIILIVATIAIPSLVRSRQSAHESAAVATLKLINTAETTYISPAGSYGSVTDLVTASLLDSHFSSGAAVSGYDFTVSFSGVNYTASAIPTSYNSGRYAYYSLPDAVIRYSTTTDAAHCGGTGGKCFPGSQSGQPVN